MRITRDAMLMKMATVVAERSSCLRLKVGAVIAKDGRVISTGYNGSPSGLPHCSPDNCGPDQPCTRTVHAEMGAITFAAKHGTAIGGSTLYCTWSPCIDCAKGIVNAGIIEVVYQNEYRKTDGIELLQAAGVEVKHFEPLTDKDPSPW